MGSSVPSPYQAISDRLLAHGGEHGVDGGGGHGGGSRRGIADGGPIPGTILAPDWGPVKEKYGIAATMEIFLNGGRTIGFGRGLASAIVGHTYGIEQEMEQLEPKKFLEKAKEFLASIGTTQIRLVRYNSNEIFRSAKDNSDNDKIKNNLEEAFTSALLLSVFKSRIGTVSVVANGRSVDFELHLAFIFTKVHPVRKPGILLRILALPLQLTKDPGETSYDYAHRMNTFLDDESQVKRLDDGSRARMRSLFTDFRDKLSSQFDVKEVKEELNVGSILV